MEVTFHKYQGTGNDFIILDNRNGRYNELHQLQISFMCNRKFGIGADGLMLFNQAAPADFHMVYYNADGRVGSMCGNGGRCMIQFAARLYPGKKSFHFEAPDGLHQGSIQEDGTVCIDMKPVSGVEYAEQYTVLNTGSPHYIQAVKDVAAADVFQTGRALQQSEAFRNQGINVNFVQRLGDHSISVRTYERGVEDETLSCGTGVTAAALTLPGLTLGAHEIEVETPGGNLKVRFIKENDQNFSSIFLCGPATFVFSGQINLQTDNL